MAFSALVSPPPMDLSLLDALVTADFGATSRAQREAALIVAARPSASTPINRFWRIDFARLDLRLDASRPLVTPRYELPAAMRAQGIVFCALSDATGAHAATVAKYFNALVPAAESRFTAIAGAFEQGGYFLYVPAGVRNDTPLRIRIDVPVGARFCPRNVIILEAGAQIQIIEEFHGGATSTTRDSGTTTLMCATSEMFVGENARVEAATEQYLDAEAQIFVTRRARIGKNAKAKWAVAELGGYVVQSRLEARLVGNDANADLTSLFFAHGTQHVDFTGEVVHEVADTQSQTVVKGAAVEHGQGRFAGNIRIEPGAHGSSASLRDDALLLSPDAHIDAIPALEIAANDVQAFHGATVGAIDKEIRFYLMSRGISAQEADRIIALAFFDRAVANFAATDSRERLNETLGNRIGSALLGD